MRFELIDMGFSTADAEYIQFAYRDGELRLTFVDWREILRVAFFEDVLVQRWHADAEFLPGIRDDATYVVQDSDLAARMVELCAVEAAHAKHFVLCFNAAGVLEVVCKSFRVVE